MNQPAAPRVSASTLPVRTDAPAVASTAPVGAAPAAPVAAAAARTRRPRSGSAPVVPSVPTPPPPQEALTDAQLLDLGRLTVLSAKAGMQPQEFVEDCRLLVTAWDRFQATLGK